MPSSVNISGETNANQVTTIVDDRIADAGLIRTDFDQSYNSTQQAQGRENINAVGVPELALSTGASLVGWSSRFTGSKSRIVRSKLDEMAVSPFDFGGSGVTFYGDGTNDDQPAIQAAIDAVSSASIVTERGRAWVSIPAGYRVRLNSPLVFNKGIKFECLSYVYYHGATSSAFIIGNNTSSNPVSNADGYDWFCQGVRAMANNNTGDPSGIDATASSGLEIRQAQFSSFRIGQAIAFKNCGVRINCTNNINANWQHVQDNDIYIGEVAYNGIGVDAQSADAALGACQVNRIHVQNSHRNYKNLNFDQSGRRNTNNNIVSILAMDAATGPTNAECWGVFNKFDVGYMDGDFDFKAGTYGNTVDVLNSTTTLANVTDATGQNRWKLAAAETGTVLPLSAASRTLGTSYENTHGCPIMVYADFVLTPGDTEQFGLVYIGHTAGTMFTLQTASAKAKETQAAIGSWSITLGTAKQNDSGGDAMVYGSAVVTAGATTEYVTVYMGASAGALTDILLVAAQPTAPANTVYPFSFMVPKGWYFKIEATGGGSASLNGSGVKYQKVMNDGSPVNTVFPVSFEVPPGWWYQLATSGGGSGGLTGNAVRILELK